MRTQTVLTHMYSCAESINTFVNIRVLSSMLLASRTSSQFWSWKWLRNWFLSRFLEEKVLLPMNMMLVLLKNSPRNTVVTTKWQQDTGMLYYSGFRLMIKSRHELVVSVILVGEFINWCSWYICKISSKYSDGLFKQPALKSPSIIYLVMVLFTFWILSLIRSQYTVWHWDDSRMNLQGIFPV